MASWRKPRGTYVRNTPDWFVQNACLAAGAFQSPGASTDDTTIDLYNDADQGQYLHVYDFWVFNDAQGMWSAGFVQDHGANFITKGVFKISNRGAPFGSVYQDTTPAPFSSHSVVIPDTPMGSMIFGGDESGALSQPKTQGPIAVIAPGNSFRVRSFISSFYQNHGIAVTFHYVILPDQG